MTCPTCVTLTRERDNARDLAAALEEELARRDGARSDVRASRAPEVAQRITEQPPIYAANHGWTPSTSPFRHDRCRVMLSRYGCPYSQADHDPALPPEDIDVFGYRRTARSPGNSRGESVMALIQRLMTVPSLPVFTAIEETRRGHGYRNPLTQLCDCGEELASEEKWRFHVTVEVARAAEVAALHALARWALADREARTHDLQGETLIPIWLIGARADALKETL